MSEHPTRTGDWLASDGRWYPAEQHPSYRPAPPVPAAPAPPPPAAPPPAVPPPALLPPGLDDTVQAERRRRSLLPILLAMLGLVVAVAVGLLVLATSNSVPKVPRNIGGPNTTTSTPGGTTPSTPTTSPPGLPSSEPLLHGGDIGQTRSYEVLGQSVKITLLAVVYPVQALSPQPISTSPLDHPPYVAVELTMHNQGTQAVAFELGSDNDLALFIAIRAGSNHWIGIDPNATSPWGTSFTLATPLPAGGTRTGWFLVATGDVVGMPPVPGPPNALEVAGPKPPPATWSFP